MNEPLYKICIDREEHGVAICGAALIDAWGNSVPDIAALSLDLRIGGSVQVFERPKIVVSRVR